MKENSVGRSIGTVGFYIFAAGILIWTASLTQSLVSIILPGNVILSWFALLLFDGGALIWLMVFMFVSSGPMQRAISLLMMCFDLIGVGLMSFAELYLGGQTLTAVPAMLGMIVIWGVGLSTIANVAAAYAYHVTDPKHAATMRLRAMKDVITMSAIEQAEGEIEARARAEGGILAARMVQGVMAELHLDGTKKPAAVKPFQPAPVTFAAESDVAINGTQAEDDFLAPPSKPIRSRKPKAS